LIQLRGQVAVVEALYAEAAQQNESLTAHNHLLEQELKLAQQELNGKWHDRTEDPRHRSV